MKRPETLSKAESSLPYIEGWGSLALNLVLFAAKYAVGTAAGSIAIVADAWHTLSDSITSLLVLIGVKWARKPPDRDHPYGHGRAEPITALVIGVILVMVGVSFANDSIGRLLAHTPAKYGRAAIWVTVISILVKEAMARFSSWAGRKTGYTALLADAWHHRSDALSSLVILGGILAGGKVWWVDGALGLMVSLMILYAALKILREVLDPLLGEAPSPELLERIEMICREEAGSALSSHHFHLHRYGFHSEMTFHIRLPETTVLAEGHRLASRLEGRIREEMGIHATIHLEPNPE